MDKVNSSSWESVVKRTLRFESQVERARTPFRKHELVLLLNLVATACDVLDKYKKTIFYGKEFSEFDKQNAFFQLSQQVDVLTRRRGIMGNPTTQLLTHDSPRAFHALLGMITEVGGEIAPALAVALEQHAPLDMANVLEEIGDFHWYEGVLLDETGVPFEASLEMTAAKLEKRYGEAYHDQGALHRDLAAERETLETKFEAAQPGSTAQK
jgi:NTP pyrophosphatase (non-canonical NTP hydrolase)